MPESSAAQAWVLYVAVGVVGEHDAGRERRIVGGFDLVANGKPKPGPMSLNVSWQACGQRGRSASAAKIDLHPLDRILPKLDCAVIAVLRPALGRGAGDLLIERRQLAAAAASPLASSVSAFRDQLARGDVRAILPARDVAIGVKRPVGPVHRGEHRLQGVVVLLRDRIELVVVAARTGRSG